MTKFGSNGNFIHLQCSYLQEHLEQVNDDKLERVTIIVPQGSMLGPLLLQLLMDDLPQGINSFISFWCAENPKHSSSKDWESLQADRGSRWLENWKRPKLSSRQYCATFTYGTLWKLNGNEKSVKDCSCSDHLDLKKLRDLSREPHNNK